MSHADALPPNTVRTRDGAALFYRDWGRGRPLLFLAGWTLASGMWAYQMEPLVRRGLRCVAYDRRSHGRSSDPGTGYDFDTLADDLSAVIEQLDLRDVTLVGHSFASGEMVRYMTRHGAGRIATLIFVAPAAIPFLTKTADNPNGVDATLFEGLRAAFAADFAGWAAANAAPYFMPETPPAAATWTINMMTEASLLAAVELSKIQTSTDFRAELARLTRPALIVHGDRDASAPLEITGRPAAALIPDARLEIYEGAPHGLYFTHAKRLNDDIAAFAAA
jgi:non-heme chloroperoxidase